MKTQVLALLALVAVPATSLSQVAGEVQVGAVDPLLVKKATDHVSRIQGDLKQVLGRVEEARNEKDIVKLNCVNEKLAQIKQILNVAEGAEISLQEAVAKGSDGADAEYSKIAIARGKADQLRSEAEECIGQLAFVVDEKTSVEVEQPEDLPAKVHLSGDTFGNVISQDDAMTGTKSQGSGFDSGYGSAYGSWGSLGGSFSAVGGAPPPPVSRPLPASRFQ